MDRKKIKGFTDSIPLPRLLLYLVVLGLLPVMILSFSWMQKRKGWEEVSEKIYEIQLLSETRVRKQALNTTVREHYGEADQFYLENQLESLSFLKKEREALERLLQSPTFTGNEAAEKRYTFLTGTGNRLQFTEGSVASGEGVQETIEILAHPVEIDTHDLKELLNRIEGNRGGKPQLIVADFNLNRKEQRNGNEVFEATMKLIKREFIR